MAAGYYHTVLKSDGTVVAVGRNEHGQCNVYIWNLYEYPVGGFTADPLLGPAPLTVNFTDESTGDITSFLWDFGDGETSIEENPTHTYTDEGIYTVSLSASGPHGSDTEVKLGYITVSEPDDDDGSGSGGCFISTPLLGI